MDMAAVRQGIRDQLSRLGYEVTEMDAVAMHASMGAWNCLAWEIKGAGQKAFEATVRQDSELSFSGQCHYDASDKETPWFAFARFKRDDNGIKKFLSWLGTIITGNNHLSEMLSPSELPSPFGFRTSEFDRVGEFIQGGQVTRTKVIGIATIDGMKLNDAIDPGTKPWFLLTLQLQSGGGTIVTDGEAWYPVVSNIRCKRILISHGAVQVLKLMNLRDQCLIRAGIKAFIDSCVKTG